MIKFAEEIQKEELFHIIGGYSATDCKNHLIGGITSGAIAGGVGAGMAGAAQGVTVCAQTGVFIPWQGYILCGAAGAATNIIWPH
ncbi:TPA: Blp family class II bacteriocin [Streptococcus pyogenes]